MASTRKEAISENRSNQWSSASDSNLSESHANGDREMRITDKILGGRIRMHGRICEGRHDFVQL
ncbi:MAG: hypothetical protein DWQ34_14295 [Planctomycetota bacterium]|nr:MAG: hypothetical protein DWQ34_14295 [Planctomycetota bacterium]REK20019.1 MAG: hypothetical protein DWQ41_27260 [Planctomycetota bacterium]REK27586.1 MAG: hypothetical protein DWQ45_26280 [Planctomycetota bacterium]